MRALLACALLLAVGLVGLSTSPDARGCAAVSRKGDKVAIATESALIIWDEKTRTQHFIRRASFATQAPYFGFLVPTPGKPDLAEVPDELFTSMEDWTKPETVTKTTYDVSFTIFPMDAKKGGKDEGVEVLGRQRVGNFDATILKADDAKALGVWLGKHGYDSTPSLEKWLEPYVKKGWVVTAFQIVKPDQADPRLSTKAVRMSFRTDRPFFPYREPAEERDQEGKRPKRFLRVFFVSNARMKGGFDGDTPTWNGQAAWANPLNESQRDSIVEAVDSPRVAVGEGAWLTVFDDRTQVRPDADLVFAPDSDQSTLKRPPIVYEEVEDVTKYVCVGSFWAFVAVVGLLFWIVRRARR